MTSTSRRNFFKNTGAFSATALLGGTGLSAFGGGFSGTAALSTQEQQQLTASQVLAAYKAGSLTATAYVRTLLARAKALSDLNAMIYLDEVGALAAAKQVDADRAAGKSLGALAGLPIVVKDNINTEAMKTTAGTSSLRNFQPANNAPSVQKLVDAGAIVLGKANLHEWAFGITSTNFTLGIDPINKAASRPCKNPYDTTRSPGGSWAVRRWPLLHALPQQAWAPTPAAPLGCPRPFAGLRASDPLWGMALAKGVAIRTPPPMPPPSAPHETLWAPWAGPWPTLPCSMR